MNQAETRIVTDANGQRGIIESWPDPQNSGNGMIGVRLENGQKLFIPQTILAARDDGSFFMPFALSEFVTSPATLASAAVPASEQLTTNAVAPVASQQAELESLEYLSRSDTGEIVIPLAAERVTVGKRVVETGSVRITKTVSEREETVDVPLLTDSFDVERVAVGRVVDVAPEVRREGETLIVPILEEVLVVEKRLMLREELHIRMKREETHQPQQVILRREDAKIERFTRDPAPVEDTKTAS